MASSVVRATVRAVSKRKIQATRAALTLTPSAVQKIKQLLKDKPEHVGVKVGVRTRGCNGLSYTLEYTKSKGDSDEEVVQDALLSARDVIWYGISLWSVGISCPSCVPSQLLVHPSPAAGGVRNKKRS
ncbi:iron-sulfur cluster assembly 1 homolog, mitochondrial isoform X2 [Heliangelus exortis]|uniref:iron-sulfur cluster assembly 1 homolog, mitochondrial isoform X2 n=1 Tax=Heliangelus exortis TaxID=472823 RepID=UPI003A8EBEB8